MKKNIVLVDDNAIFRNGLKEIIEKLGPYEVLHQFGEGKQFLNALPLHPAPDLIILDNRMPGMNGPEVLKSLNEQGNAVPVLVLTLDDAPAMIQNMLVEGACGCLNKDCGAVELREALKEIFALG